MNWTLDNSTILIVAAAVLLLALVLVLLARTGRKPPEAPVETPAEFSPIAPDEPLPEATMAPGLSATELAPSPAPAPALGPPDPLTRMKGLGPKAEALLNGMGVVRYDQIAAWEAADVARIDAQMGAFKGRIERDRWVEQARFLSEDDVAGFEERFGKLG
ncbi:hypothetical protein [Sphingomonas sp.]|uniref:hypothetical protein n=1 Tax=Sphingomonas sp. TaxID=28214 RepID=UPI003AFF7669